MHAYVCVLLQYVYVCMQVCACVCAWLSLRMCGDYAHEVQNAL